MLIVHRQYAQGQVRLPGVQLQGRPQGHPQEARRDRAQEVILE